MITKAFLLSTVLAVGTMSAAIAQENVPDCDPDDVSCDQLDTMEPGAGQPNTTQGVGTTRGGDETDDTDTSQGMDAETEEDAQPGSDDDAGGTGDSDTSGGTSGSGSGSGASGSSGSGSGG